MTERKAGPLTLGQLWSRNSGDLTTPLELNKREKATCRMCGMAPTVTRSKTESGRDVILYTPTPHRCDR